MTNKKPRLRRVGSATRRAPKLRFGGLRRHLGIVSFVVALPALAALGCTSNDDVAAQQKDLGGAVQFADVERAALETAQCLEDAGYKASEPSYDSSIYAFSFGIQASGDEAAVVLRQCIDEHYQAVSDLWQEANRSDLEARDREIDQSVLRCLRERGLKADDLSPENLERIESEEPGAREECLVEALDARS